MFRLIRAYKGRLICMYVLGGAVLKLVTRVKRLEGLLQQRKRRLVLSDSEGDDATKEQEFDLAALHTLASVNLGDDPSATAAGPDVDSTMPVERTSTTRRRLRKSSPGVRVLAAAFAILAASSVDPAVRAAAATILAASSVDAAVPAAAAPSSSIPTDKGKEELAQKAQAESVASPIAHGQGMSDQRRMELDAAQLIYTEADWLDMLAKIATNSTLSKQLLGDDVTEENMNERLGMLLMRKQRELAEQSRVKPMTKTQQQDYMREFVKDCSAAVYNQGWTMKKVKTLNIDQLRLKFEFIQKNLERSNLLNFRRSTFDPKPTLDAPPAKRASQGAPHVHAVSIHDPAGVPTAPSIPTNASLPTASSSDPAAIHIPAVSIAHADVSVPAEPMVDPAESPMDHPLTAPAHGSSEPTVAVPSSSSSRHRRKHLAKKRVTPIVDVADAAMINSDSDSDDDPLPYAPYAGWEMGDLHVLFQSLDDADALHFWRTQDSWRIRSWRLYPRAQVHVLEMVDGRVIHMFVDVSYPLSVVQEQTALGKDQSNPLMAVMVCQKPLGYFSSPMTHVPRAELMLLSHDPAVLGVPVGFELLLFGWMLLVLFMLLE
nr:hypothetical protein [Tanacetum cinerariifolium]